MNPFLGALHVSFALPSCKEVTVDLTDHLRWIMWGQNSVSKWQTQTNSALRFVSVNLYLSFEPWQTVAGQQMYFILPEPRKVVLKGVGVFPEASYNLNNCFSWFSALLLGSLEVGPRRRLCEPLKVRELWMWRRVTDIQVSERLEESTGICQSLFCSERVGEKALLLPAFLGPTLSAGCISARCFSGS